MNTRQLGILAVLAVLSVGATAAVLHTGAPTIASDRRGQRVLPGLAEQAKDISALVVREGSDTLSLERRDAAFVSADSGFPIKADAVRDLIGGAVELTFEEARTSDPARYGDLGLADPGAADGAGKEITLRAASGEIADFILGNRDNTVGGPIGGEYLRLKASPQTWLVRGNVTLPGSRADWFAPVDLGIKRNEIKKIELAGGGRDAVTAAVTAEKPDQLILRNVPEKRVPDAFKVSRFATLIESFAFQDVRKKSQPADDPRRLSADVGDALHLVITSVGDLKDGWVQIAAEATSEAARARANAIHAKVEAYEFRLPPQQTELLGWTLADVTDEQKS
jgi:hypothetical protein